MAIQTFHLNSLSHVPLRIGRTSNKCQNNSGYVNFNQWPYNFQFQVIKKWILNFSFYFLFITLLEAFMISRRFAKTSLQT